MPTPFDPRKHVRQLENGARHLDLKWRLIWLRAENPDAEIETQIVVGDDDIAICRATIRLPNGGSGCGHGTAVREQDERYVEDAENRALSRALATLGYGAEFEDEDEIEIQPTLQPPVELMSARTLLNRQEMANGEDDTPAETSPEEADVEPRSDTTQPAREQDISWSKFWEWAKARGYNNASQLSEMLEVDVLALTPAEVRRLLVRYELDHPPPGQSE